MKPFSHGLVENILEKHGSHSIFYMQSLTSYDDFEGLRRGRVISTPAVGMRFSVEPGREPHFAKEPRYDSSQYEIEEAYRSEGTVKLLQSLTLPELFNECKSVSPATLLALVTARFNGGVGAFGGNNMEAIGVVVPGMRVQSLPVYSMEKYQRVGFIWPWVGSRFAKETDKTNQRDLPFEVEIVKHERKGRSPVSGSGTVRFGDNLHSVAFQRRWGGNSIGVKFEGTPLGDGLPITVTREGIVLPSYHVEKGEDITDQEEKWESYGRLRASNELEIATLTYVIARAEWFCEYFPQGR